MYEVNYTVCLVIYLNFVIIVKLNSILLKILFIKELKKNSRVTISTKILSNTAVNDAKNFIYLLTYF